MEKFKIILCVLLIALVGCSKGSEEPSIENTFDKVVGKWIITSYYSSGGYFVPSNDGEFYEFSSNGKYTHGGGYVDTNNGTYSFDTKNDVVNCKESRGWDFVIYATFADSKNATFDIKGKTQNQSKIVKVTLQ